MMAKPQSVTTINNVSTNYWFNGAWSREDPPGSPVYTACLQSNHRCLEQLFSGKPSQHNCRAAHGQQALHLLQQQACGQQVLGEAVPPLGQQVLALLGAGGLLAGRRLLPLSPALSAPLLAVADLPHQHKVCGRKGAEGETGLVREDG